jgi:hypothetical protein
MKLVQCIQCGDDTTNMRTKKCDICKTKEIIKRQKEREK